MKNILVTLGFLSVITVIGVGWRWYRLAQAPPSVNWDEASYGYNAYSLWTTGKDEYGTPLPWSIRSFDDFKPPVYAYLTAPIVGIFGLSEITTRATAALFGVLTIILTFCLTSRLFKNTRMGLVAAVVVATAPWSVHYSRLAFEAVVALPLLLISWWYLLEGENNKSKYAWALGFATLSYFSYNSHKIYWLFVAMWIGIKLIREIPKHLKLIIVLGVISLPIGWSVISGNSLARFSSTSVLPLYQETHSIYLFAGEVVNRYMAYYSPINIFVRGTNEPNQKVYNLSVFFPFQILFYAAGGIWVLKYWRRIKFLSFWWIVAPIPAALTWSWFTPIRVLPLWWISSVVIAAGIWQIWMRLQRQTLLRGIYILGTTGWWAINIWWLLLTLVWYMPYQDYGQWQWGFREAIAIIKPLQNQYSKIVWETPQAQPHIFGLFYLKYSPAKYQKFLGSPTAVSIPRTNFDIPGIEFRKIFWPVDKKAKDVLYVGGVYSLPEKDLIRDRVKFIKDVTDPQGYVVYRIAGF